LLKLKVNEFLRGQAIKRLRRSYRSPWNIRKLEPHLGERESAAFESAV
jgi:hypothetical protein